MDIRWIAAPLVGCIIGYITNWIAIKMLFRPLKPKRIGRWRIPFTPGLIPKEKERLSAAIGDVISKNLLDTETVQKALMSDEMKKKLEGALWDFAQGRRDDTRTLAECAAQTIGEERFSRGLESARGALADHLSEKLIAANLGELAAKAIVEHVKKRSPAALAGLVSGILDERVKRSIIGQLSDGVNRYIRENARDALGRAIDKESDVWLNIRICDWVGRNEERINSYREKLVSLYETLIPVGTARALAAVDVAGIVRDRIRGFDEMELEALILGVIKRELNAIVWLGAGLGFLMGFINLLFA